MIKKFNNLLAILLGVIVIPGIWLLEGLAVIHLAGLEIIGATIVVWTMIAQYFFRKKPPQEPPKEDKP